MQNLKPRLQCFPRHCRCRTLVLTLLLGRATGHPAQDEHHMSASDSKFVVPEKWHATTLEAVLPSVAAQHSVQQLQCCSYLFIEGVASLMYGASETLCQFMLLEACSHAYISWVGTCIGTASLQFIGKQCCWHTVVCVLLYHDHCAGCFVQYCC